MNVRQKVVEEARRWIGTPYHHRAKVLGAGVDCIQLLVAVYSACGLIEDADTGDYPMDWMLHRDEERYLNGVMQYAVETDTPLPGDVVVWRFGRCISHGGIIVEWPFIIHAYRPERSCVFGDASKGDLGER